jgi:DNA-binding MarR family transcriptional regulator
VSREDSRRGAGVGDEVVAAQPSAPEIPLALTAEEKSLLETLVACGTARTVAQLCASSGLDRGQVIGMLKSLRAKGVVTRFNTLVESYAARFPGIEV